MKMQVSTGHFCVINTNRHIILFVFAFLFFSPSVYKEVWGDEKDDIKKQMQELRQQMDSMQKKLQELEEKNKKLEEEAQKQKEEKEVEKALTETAPPPQPGFLQKFVQSLNPDISIIGIFSGAYFTTDDPIVHAEADPENTGINLQEIEIGFQGVVDPYVRFGFVNTNNNSFVPPRRRWTFPRKKGTRLCRHAYIQSDRVFKDKAPV